MHSLRAAAAAIAIAVIFGSLIGCGSGGDNGVQPPGPAGAIRLEGRVVAADNAGALFPSASVTVLPAGQTVIADANGHFVFTGLDSVPLTVQVNPLYHPEYQACEILLPALTSNYLNLNVAVLPRSADTVTSLAIAPQNQVVEIGSQIPFRAAIVTSAGATGLRPTWVALGPAGRIDESGLFIATATGQSTIYAFSGTRYTTTTIRVVAQRAPAILDVLLDPTQLPAEGGQMTVTASLADADGVSSAMAIIFSPGGTSVNCPMSLVLGTANNGTWAVTDTIPPNTNLPDTNGIQAPMRYQVGVRAVDADGRVTFSDLVEFFVAGVAPPPPPPA